MAAAQAKAASGTWLAATAESQTADVWGRLTLKDGVLAFASTTVEWHRPLAEIKRVAVSTRFDGKLEIEDLNGELLVVTILGVHMTPESPRKALQLIERARREAPRATTVTTVAAGGGQHE